MAQKCSLPEAERAGALELFTGRLSDEQENTIKDLFPQYLFFRNEFPDDGWEPATVPVRMCTCTACGEEFQAVRGNYAKGKLHHEKCNCPQCGRELEGIAVGKYKYDMPSLTQWVKVAVVDAAPDGALLIEAGEAKRRFTWDSLTGEIEWNPQKRYYLRAGGTVGADPQISPENSGSMRASTPTEGTGNGAGAVQMWSHKATYWECGRPGGWGWFAERAVKEPFQPNLMGSAEYYGEYPMIGLVAALRSSAAFRYCQIMDFYYYEYTADLARPESARWMAKYLAWYAELPQIEMAVKLGLSDAVRDLIENGRKNARLLDWSARRPDAFLRASKEDARLFRQNEMTFQDLKDWRGAKGVGLGRWLDMVKQAGGNDTARELAAVAKTAGVSFERALHYVKGLGPGCARGGGGPLMETIREWKDYLAMAEQLRYDFREETVRLPKDLRDRHDAAAAIIRHEASEKEQKKYGKRRKALEKRFAFELDGLRVLVPACSQEIVQEGKILHHCVGGYAARHLEGTATILFLRKSRKPGRSFLTVELYKERGVWKLRQIHGYRNEGYATGAEKALADPKKRYAGCLETWLGWVNAGSPRDQQGKPIMTVKEEAV